MSHLEKLKGKFKVHKDKYDRLLSKTKKTESILADLSKQIEEESKKEKQKQ